MMSVSIHVVFIYLKLYVFVSLWSIYVLNTLFMFVTVN